MYTKRLLCLANSKKPPSGRCIAGKEIVGHSVAAWIRPVSGRPGHEISEDDRRYEDGTTAQALQIVDIPLLKPASMQHQRENHLIADDHYWTKIREATWSEVRAALDTVNGVLWVNGHSTQHGVNDKVPELLLNTMGDSLKLIDVPKLTISVATEAGFDGAPGRRRVRGQFQLQGVRYCLSVTDPIVEAEHLAKPNGTYDSGPVVLCISLSEPFHGYAFKLIATVISKTRCGA